MQKYAKIFLIRQKKKSMITEMIDYFCDNIMDIKKLNCLC